MKVRELWGAPSLEFSEGISRAALSPAAALTYTRPHSPAPGQSFPQTNYPTRPRFLKHS